MLTFYINTSIGYTTNKKASEVFSTENPAQAMKVFFF